MARGKTGRKSEMLLKSAEMIGWALGGLEREIALTKERLSSLNAQAARLRARLGTRASAATGEALDDGTNRAKRRRTMSPEARKRISEMMKKRWEERRKSR